MFSSIPAKPRADAALKQDAVRSPSVFFRKHSGLGKAFAIGLAAAFLASPLTGCSWMRNAREGDWLKEKVLLLKSEDPEVRSRASYELTRFAGLRDKRVVKPLAEALKDQVLSVRLNAIDALKEACDDCGVNPEAKRPGEVDFMMRYRIEYARENKALIKSCNELAVEPLISALKGDAESFARAAAATALGKTGSERAGVPLVEALQDKDEVVREAAASALGLLRDQRFVEPLIGMLKDERPSVRAKAASALSKTGDSRAVEPLIGALADKDAWVRMCAAESLGWLGDARAVAPIIQNALKSSDEFLRRKGVLALANIGGKSAIEPLVQLLGDKSPFVRSSAAEALISLGDARAVEPLIKALADWYVWARAYSAEALGKIGDKRAVEPLINALKDGDPSVRCSAASALASLRDARAVDSFINALKDEDVIVRCEAAKGLSEIGDARAVEPLLALLLDKNGISRQAAAEALGNFLDIRVVDPLIKALSDEDGNTRCAALVALERIKRQIFYETSEPFSSACKRIRGAIDEASLRCGGGSFLSPPPRPPFFPNPPPSFRPY